MLKKIIILAATTSFMALAAHNTAMAQSAPNGAGKTLEDVQRECREDAADRGFSDGMRYTDWANTESRQAADYRELARNARKNADASTAKADKDMWKADAERYDANAKDLEAKARQDLDRGKAGFAKYREQEPCVNILPAMDAFIDSVIEGGELRATHAFWDENPAVIEGEVIDPAKIKQQAEKAEKTEPKADPEPRKEKKKVTGKKPTKIEKVRSATNLKKSGKAGKKVAKALTQALLAYGQYQSMSKYENHYDERIYDAERRRTMEGKRMKEGHSGGTMKFKRFMTITN